MRETYRLDANNDGFKPTAALDVTGIWYEADGSMRGHGNPGKLRPAIHMPRFAARFGLMLESVRVEPLQAIDDRDAVAEGIERLPGNLRVWRIYDGPAGGAYMYPRDSYASLWGTLHQKKGERWEDNPDVVVLTFSKAWVDR